MSTTIGTPISALPPVPSSLLTDEIPAVQLGQTMRATVQQITANCIQIAGGNPPVTGPFVISSGGINVTGTSYIQGGGLALDNGQFIDWKDSHGNYKGIIAVDSSNNTDISDAGGGIVTISKNLWIGGSGIYYNGVGGGHTIAFTWDNTAIHLWVDGLDQGQLASVSWVQNWANANFATTSWVNGNFLPRNNPNVGGNGIVYGGLSGASAHAIGFAWDGANFIHGYVDRSDVGALAPVTWVQGQLGNYLSTSGGTVSNLSVTGTFNTNVMNASGVVNANGGLAVNNAALTCNTTLYAEAGGVCAGQGWLYQLPGLSSANIAFGWDGRIQVWVNGSLVGHLVPA